MTYNKISQTATIALTAEEKLIIEKIRAIGKHLLHSKKSKMVSEILNNGGE